MTFKYGHKMCVNSEELGLIMTLLPHYFVVCINFITVIG